VAEERAAHLLAGRKERETGKGWRQGTSQVTYFLQIGPTSQ
jgi:hypothetical protein